MIFLIDELLLFIVKKQNWMMDVLTSNHGILLTSCKKSMISETKILITVQKRNATK